jgi:hypothetical protein
MALVTPFLPEMSISDTGHVMSYAIRDRTNVGAYDRPFSGVSVEFDSLGVKPGRTGITLHESGYLPANTDWKYGKTGGGEGGREDVHGGDDRGTDEAGLGDAGPAEDRCR